MISAGSGRRLNTTSPGRIQTKNLGQQDGIDPSRQDQRLTGRERPLMGESYWGHAARQGRWKGARTEPGLGLGLFDPLDLLPSAGLVA